MKKTKFILVVSLFIAAGGLLLIYDCSPSKPEPVKTVTIADGDFDPANWGKAYPLEYEFWLKSKEPRPAGKSKYKRGNDNSVMYDKLSEYPYLPLLFNGWGFGVEYNEPRGHYNMLIDQLNIDPSRLKAGGACLTCKTPYAPKLRQEMGLDYFRLPYVEVHSRIPQKFQQMGVVCVDCHDNKTLNPKLSRWTLKNALADIGKDVNQVGRQEMRSLVCAQCHVTYVVKKDAEMKSIDVFFPWKNSKVGDISIENIIKVIKSDPSNLEWKQAVTGFKLGFIRHPEYEFYSRNSVHYKADVSCADCHMPYTRVGVNKISDHNVMSPLKNDMRACQQCHTETPQWLTDQVIAVQDRTVSLINRAGYAAAVSAKLFETANKAQEQGKKIDQALYQQAKNLYEEAMYRIIFIGAENSVGFHNPSEAGRICGDAIAMAMKADGILRQALAKAGVEVPANINMEIAKYINNRGVKKLKFRPEFEFKDPFGIQEMITPVKSMGR